MSHAEMVITWEQFHTDVSQLVAKLRSLAPQWAGIIAITRGGLIPAGIVASELDIRLIDTYCIETYRGHQSSEERVLKTAEMYARSATRGQWLVIDDLVDSGKTARLARRAYPNALIAVVYGKPAGVPWTDVYVGDCPQDHWIVFPWDVPPAVSPPLKEGEEGIVRPNAVPREEGGDAAESEPGLILALEEHFRLLVQRPRSVAPSDRVDFVAKLLLLERRRTGEVSTPDLAQRIYRAAFGDEDDLAEWSAGYAVQRSYLSDVLDVPSNPRKNAVR